jgi:hypothetical protein
VVGQQPPAAAGNWFDPIPKAIPSKDPALSSDPPLFPGGTALTSDRTPEKKKEDAGYLIKPSGAAEDEAEKDAGYGGLYKSNQKQKRIEDYHDGLNKPVEVDEANDRYHKPQKPQ